MVSFGLLALRPPVRNEEFIQDVTRLVGGKKARPACSSLHASPACEISCRRGAQNTPIYVICASGGTLETASERKARRRRARQQLHGTPALTRVLAPGCALFSLFRSARPTFRRQSLASTAPRAARCWRATSWWSRAASPTWCTWCVLYAQATPHPEVVCLHGPGGADLPLRPSLAQEGGYSSWVARKLPGDWDA